MIFIIQGPFFWPQMAGKISQYYLVLFCVSILLAHFLILFRVTMEERWVSEFLRTLFFQILFLAFSKLT